MLTVGEGKDYKTIGAAIAAASAADTIEVYPGIYRESVKVNKPVSLIGIDKPLIDGGWHGEVVADSRVALLTIAADGATVEGLRVENSPGRGVTIAANDAILRDCHIRNVRMDGFVANGANVGGLRNILVEGCSFIGLSQKMADSKADQAAGSSFVAVYVLNSTFMNNIVGDGYKEGFNIDKNTRDCLYTGNILFDTNHGGCYFNHSQGNIVRGNVFLHTNPKKYQGARGDFPAAVVFGDERMAESKAVDKSRDNQYIANVVVGWGRMVEVRNNSKNPGGYDTQLLNTLIANNTFIAGPETSDGISIAANLYGRPHEGSLFVGNAVYLTGAREGADIGTMGAGGGVRFSHNGWTTQPPRTMQGEGDVYGELGLTNPQTPLHRIEESPYTDYNADNYRPLPDSPLVPLSIGALRPLPSVPPPDPEPDITQVVIQRLESLADLLETMSGAVEASAIAVQDALQLMVKLNEEG